MTGAWDKDGTFGTTFCCIMVSDVSPTVHGAGLAPVPYLLGVITWQERTISTAAEIAGMNIEYRN